MNEEVKNYKEKLLKHFDRVFYEDSVCDGVSNKKDCSKYLQKLVKAHDEMKSPKDLDLFIRNHFPRRFYNKFYEAQINLFCEIIKN